MLIEADFSKQWDVPELARALQVSISQLHRKLTALTGMHTTEFVRYVRLVRACEKLRSNLEEKIVVIAYEVGFTSPNEFARRFKEVFGMTPGEWRK
jgi:AraC-like DNA-binding protein